MRTCAWLVAGAVLLFGVSGHPGFFNLQVAGLILIARGAAGWWLSLNAGRRALYLKRLRAAAVTAEAFTAELTRDGSKRVPLDVLLSQGAKESSQQ
ncbi:MAG TPA: hypothetical protein VMA95_09385 [Streptosporangiaceae bacterium]|nr:hypothetical protein [Streptosporangiaceae bacterium]